MDSTASPTVASNSTVIRSESLLVMLPIIANLGEPVTGQVEVYAGHRPSGRPALFSISSNPRRPYAARPAGSTSPELGRMRSMWI